jgi:hypothetical protein
MSGVIRTPRPLHPTAHRAICRAVSRVRAANDAVHYLWAQMSAVCMQAGEQEGAIPTLDFVAQWEEAQKRVETETRTLGLICELHWPEFSGRDLAH